jgi:integrase
MAKRKREKPYRNGDCTLGRRGSKWVVDIRVKGAKRQRPELEVRNDETPQQALDRFAEARRAVQKQQAAHTVGELWAMWLAERAADKLDNAIYRANWVSLAPVFASRSPHLLVAQDFRDYATGRFDAGRSPWTVHTELVRLRACLKWAAEANHISVRPKVWVPSPGKHRERVLSAAEARRLADGAKDGDPHICLFVVIAFATGARHTAILDLTWDRIDFARGLIAFDEDLPRDPMSKSWRKGRAIVPMNRAVRAALELAHEGRQSKWVIEHGGRRLKTVREGFANACRRAGLADVTPHTIRHTVATWLEDRVPDARRAQLLGHGDIETTRRVYTHSGVALLEEAVSYLDFAPLPRIAHQEAGLQVEEGSKSAKSVPAGQDGQLLENL